MIFYEFAQFGRWKPNCLYVVLKMKAIFYANKCIIYKIGFHLTKSGKCGILENDK